MQHNVHAILVAFLGDMLQALKSWIDRVFGLSKSFMSPPAMTTEQSTKLKKANKTEILEAKAAVSDSSMVTVMNRPTYHSISCIPRTSAEADVDSEEELDPLWLRAKTCKMIDEFSDVNEGEKTIMKMWNLIVMRYNFVADKHMALACFKMVEVFGREILMRNLYRNFQLHLINMCDFKLIEPVTVFKTIQLLQNLLVNMPEFKDNCKKSSNNQRRKPVALVEKSVTSFVAQLHRTSVNVSHEPNHKRQRGNTSIIDFSYQTLEAINNDILTTMQKLQETNDTQEACEIIDFLKCDQFSFVNNQPQDKSVKSKKLMNGNKDISKRPLDVSVSQSVRSLKTVKNNMESRSCKNSVNVLHTSLPLLHETSPSNIITQKRCRKNQMSQSLTTHSQERNNDNEFSGINKKPILSTTRQSQGQDTNSHNSFGRNKKVQANTNSLVAKKKKCVSAMSAAPLSPNHQRWWPNQATKAEECDAFGFDSSAGLVDTSGRTDLSPPKKRKYIDTNQIKSTKDDSENLSDSLASVWRSTQ